MITFGQPSDFAIKLLPLRGAPPEPDPAAAATWVALEICVAGKNLTAHTHEDSGIFHTGIHWPAIYLARWLVRSWHGLFESARWPIPGHRTNALAVARHLDELCLDAGDDDPIVDEHDRFVSNHALAAAAAGAIMPGIYLAREDMCMSVAWDSPQIGDVVFHRQHGKAWIPLGSFLKVVRQFVDWTVDALGEIAETDDRDELSAWLGRVDTRDQAVDVLLGYAGLRPDTWNAIRPQADTSVEEFVEEFFRLDIAWAAQGAMADPTESPVAVAFRCCSPELTPDDLVAIREVVMASQPYPQAMPMLERLTAAIPDVVGTAPDYEQGYELAVRTRELLGNERDPLDIEVVLSGWHIPVTDVDLRDPDVDGGSICDAAHGPIVFVNQRSEKAGTPWGRRMVLAHELCHLLFDRRQAVPLAILSGLWAPARVERRANAFAAELLLPLAGIMAMANNRRDRVTDELYGRLMDTYKIGLKTCAWHVANRFIGNE